jgi:hypothetical protein
LRCWQSGRTNGVAAQFAKILTTKATKVHEGKS